MQALKENGFTSFIIDDHVPNMIDDTRWGHRVASPLAICVR
ncbi:MAG: hypothetical protein R2867_11725 [Caldilineaceae bacterium]